MASEANACLEKARKLPADGLPARQHFVHDITQEALAALARLECRTRQDLCQLVAHLVGREILIGARRGVTCGLAAAFAAMSRKLPFGDPPGFPSWHRGLGFLIDRHFVSEHGACPLLLHGWHALRHYAISAWLAAGIDLKTVQRWAGHAALTLTLDTYGHMIPRQDDHARIAVAERLLG